MLKIMIDKKKGINNVSFEGTTHEIYKELMTAVVFCLDDMELETSKGKEVVLSEAIITFGQHLVMFATQQQKYLDSASELKKAFLDVISDLEKRGEE